MSHMRGGTENYLKRDLAESTHFCTERYLALSMAGALTLGAVTDGTSRELHERGFMFMHH